MKITGGILRGRLISFRKHASVRPTASRVREAVFSMLGQELTNRRFLDAFGGSGIMGIEAYSRGAKTTICEKDFKTAAFIRSTLKKLDADIDVLNKPVPKALGDRTWQDIFLDPPYAEAPQLWLDRLAAYADERIIIEFHHRWALPVLPTPWQLERNARYGDSCIAIYTRG